MLFKSPATEQDIRALLEGVAGVRIGGIQITSAAHALVTLEIDPADAADFESLRQETERRVAGLPGLKKATVILTAERPAPAAKPTRLDLPGVKKIIAVGSGKGGVGKSTVAANLAVALAQRNLKIGLLDADIYGPSVPRLMGLSGRRPVQGADKKLIPFTAHGLKVMSMGFMVDEETPMIWRGPMVQSAILQLLRDVAWTDLDILVIDMPPGTGDAQLTLAQKAPLAGAVIVSTPQDLALLDARKGLEMFRKVAVPILGIVENMSYYSCPACGHRADIFGHGGAQLQAAKAACPFLGEIPLDAVIRSSSDAGLPITVAEPEGPQARAFQTIAGRLLEGLKTSGKPAPRIVIRA